MVIAAPSVEAVGRFAQGSLALVAVHRRLDGGGNACRDLILHRKYIGKAAVIALGPQTPARRRFHELRRHPHAVAGLTDAAFEDIPHTELAPDVFDCN